MTAQDDTRRPPGVGAALPNVDLPSRGTALIAQHINPVDLDLERFPRVAEGRQRYPEADRRLGRGGAERRKILISADDKEIDGSNPVRIHGCSIHEEIGAGEDCRVCPVRLVDGGNRAYTVPRSGEREAVPLVAPDYQQHQGRCDQAPPADAIRADPEEFPHLRHH